MQEEVSSLTSLTASSAHILLIPLYIPPRQQEVKSFLAVTPLVRITTPPHPASASEAPTILSPTHFIVLRPRHPLPAVHHLPQTSPLKEDLPTPTQEIPEVVVAPSTTVMMSARHVVATPVLSADRRTISPRHRIIGTAKMAASLLPILLSLLLPRLLVREGTTRIPRVTSRLRLASVEVLEAKREVGCLGLALLLGAGEVGTKKAIRLTVVGAGRADGESIVN